MSARARLSAGDRRHRGVFLHRSGQDRQAGRRPQRPRGEAIEAYLKKLGVELHGDAFLFLNRSAAPYSSDTLGDDFRDVRHMEFGAKETRTLADFRRSGAQEAFAGDAQPADVSHAIGNTIATSNMLFATCNPVNMASVRKVHEARIKGRRNLWEGGRTTRPALGQKAKGGTE